MKNYPKFRALFWALIIGWQAFAGRFADAQNMPRMPLDVDRVDIYLHTVDIGNLVYNNFGHTAIRVHDRGNGEDWVFNWGIFDFGEPLSFAFQFYRGFLIYNLGVYPYSVALRQYQFEQRTVWEDLLNLTHAEKTILLERLIWNAQPENRAYQYDYFFDNCSTRPRDYLDEALDGLIRLQTKDEFTEHRFRDYVREGYRYNPFIQLSLDILMNSRIDRQVSVWDSMFHPLDLRQALLDIEKNERPLIYSSRVLLEFPRPAKPLFDGFTAIGLFGLLMLLAIIAVFYQARRLQDDKATQSAKLESLGYRLMGALALPLFLYGGILGLLMPITWAFSAHLDLHHNVNILLFWPIDIWLVWPAAVWLWKGRAWHPPRRARFLIQAHLMMLVGLWISWALGYVNQDIGLIMLSVTPVYLALFSLMLHKGMALTKEA